MREALSNRSACPFHFMDARLISGEEEALFGIEPKRPAMAVIFIIDRTFQGFLQNVVDAVLNLYDRYLEPDDLVGYYGLGDGWIFETVPKGDAEAGAALRGRRRPRLTFRDASPDRRSSIPCRGSRGPAPRAAWTRARSRTCPCRCAY